MSDRTCRLP